MSSLAAVLHKEPQPASQSAAIFRRNWTGSLPRSMKKDPGAPCRVCRLKVALDELPDQMEFEQHRAESTRQVQRMRKAGGTARPNAGLFWVL